MKKMIMMIAAMLMCTAQLNAQNTKVPEKELVGVWIMESMQFEGERKITCGKKSGYAQFKYYGADGEYACAEISLSKDGTCTVFPHEYGTYSFKNGMYSEMGRPAIKDAIVLTDKNTYRGTWMNRHDVWKKQSNMPKKLVQYIIDCCKTKEAPADIQKLIKQNFFQ